MRKELSELCVRLSALLNGARPVLLPYPYSTGHFRVYTGQELPADREFTSVRRGSTLFVTVTDEGLARALQKMAEHTSAVDVRPELSPLHTLIAQILRRGYVLDEMDCPRLARLALDLDGDPVRSQRVIAQMEPLLRREYAQALRQERKHSMLPLIAGQVADYI